MERDEEHFDLDQEFTASAEDVDYDRFIERVDRRKPVVKSGKAAWSKLEDVLAEKRLKKELKDFYDRHLNAGRTSARPLRSGELGGP